MPRSGERRRDREKERERGEGCKQLPTQRRLHARRAHRKYRSHLSLPHEESRGFPSSRGGTRPKTGDRLLARPRLGGKLYALDPTPFPIFLSRSRCEPANPPLVYDHRRSDRCRYLVFSFRDEEDRGFNATAYTYLEI